MAAHNILRSTKWVDIPSNISIAELMNDNVSNTPEDKIIYEDALTGKTATYGGFRLQVRQSAYWLRHSLGVKPGQTVSIMAPSCIDYILVVHAVWWIGGIVSPINNSLHRKEIAFAVDLIQPDYLVIHDSLFETLPRALRLCQDCPPELQIMALGKAHNEWIQFSSSTISGSPEVSQAFSLQGRNSGTIPCAILLSSGTTGKPKAVMLSHYNLISAIQQLRADNPDNWRGSQREIFFPPLSHVYALYVCMTGACWLGAYVCLMPRFDLEVYCRLLQDRKATLARLVPPIAKLLAENPIVQKYTYPSLEYFSCSAAPLNAETAGKLRAVFPGVALCQTYGCTELSGPCVQSGVRDTSLPLSAAGTLIANTEMRFVDLDGTDVGSKGPGEITVRGPNVMMGYKDNSDATAESMLEGNWYRTGDLGYIDNNGFLVIFDRLKDIIKYNGFQVSPTELEEILVKHDVVDEAAVCGVWSEKDSTELSRAYVVLKGGSASHPPDIQVVHAQSISKFVSGQVSSYKQLKGGVVFVDSLPKNPTGKVLRRVLRLEQEKFEKGGLLAKL
ncbi:4-coumarate--CoA ligase 2 [Lachnellula cervina]|uniref:4-coumarate--CoA ligase 2 n=1 Tax=Lachnellula cervina TaxID=1316786 RepID=A0A7D8YQ80_9HELO|nr:4-coumarate--CoA ligase 2 [Lachnellula cervina]